MSACSNQLNLSYFRKPIEGRFRQLHYGDEISENTSVLTNAKHMIDDDQSDANLSSFIDEIPNSKLSDSSPVKIDKKKNIFILDEADVTNGDMIDTQLDCSDLEFIDDDTHVNERSEGSIYLKSLKNLVGPQNKYKLKYDYDHDLDVKSQRQYGSIFVSENDDDDEYQQDSFCNDEIVYASDDTDDHLSSSTTNVNLKLTPKQPKRMLMNPTSSSTPINPIKKRRRIITDDDD